MELCIAEALRGFCESNQAHLCPYITFQGRFEILTHAKILDNIVDNDQIQTDDN